MKRRYKNKALKSARKLRRRNAVRVKLKATTTTCKELPDRRSNKKVPQRKRKRKNEVKIKTVIKGNLAAVIRPHAVARNEYKEVTDEERTQNAISG